MLFLSGKKWVLWVIKPLSPLFCIVKQKFYMGSGLKTFISNLEVALYGQFNI